MSGLSAELLGHPFERLNDDLSPLKLRAGLDSQGMPQFHAPSSAYAYVLRDAQAPNAVVCFDHHGLSDDSRPAHQRGVGLQHAAAQA